MSQDQIRAEVEGIGTLEFPAGTDPSVIQQTVRRVIAERQQKPRADFQASNEKDASGNPVVNEQPGALSRFGSSLARNLLPSTTPSDYLEGPLYAAKHPIDSAGLILKAMIDAHRGQASKTVESAKQIFSAPTFREQSLALPETFGHALATVFPVVGPAAAAAGEQFVEGDIAGGIGSMAGLLVPSAMSAGRAMRGSGAPKVSAPHNAADASAVEFARQNDIPVDAGTASGNRFVKSVQGLADHSPLGSVIAERSKLRTGEALASTGKRLAEDANPGGATVGAVEAGEAVRGALTKQIEQSHIEATTAYDALRDFEAKAAAESVATGGTTTKRVATGAVDAAGNPVMRSVTTPAAEAIKFAVDLRQSKGALKVIYDRLKREADLVPLQGGKARALTALDRLMSGPDFAPLSIVDEALGDLKAMARGADMPELRTQGQGIAAEAVKKLDTQVRARAAAAGPDVLRALEQGRASTRNKYAVAEALDVIAASDEPRGVFNRLTANGDAGLNKLRELQKHAPDQLPTVGRALLENLLDKPTSEGGFKFADKALSDWRRVGPETKKLLFTPEHIKALDDFFLIAKRLGESPNPSQSGLVLNAGGQLALAFTNPVTGVPVILGSGVVSGIMHSPKALEALLNGLRLMGRGNGATKLAAVQFVKASRAVGRTTSGHDRPRAVADATDREDSRRAPARASQQ